MANHISHAGLPYPVKGCRFTLLIPYLDADGDPTDPTTPDTERSIDAGSFADCTEEVSTITGGNGTGYITLTGDELNGSAVALAAKVASGPKNTLATLYPRVLAVLYSGTASAGASGSITLASDVPAIADLLIGCIVRTTGGTGGGGGSGSLNNQARVVTDFTTGRVASISPNWETTPDNTTTYEVLLTEAAILRYADVLRWNAQNVATPATNGVPSVDAVYVSGDSTAADKLEAWMDALLNNTAQAGAAGSITLNSGASATDNYYKGLILITGGTGVGQWRLITGYTGSTKVATVSPNWATNPDNTSTFILFPAGQVDVWGLFGTAFATPNVAGVPIIDLKYFLGSAITGTAAQIATAFTKFFDKASPTGTINSLPDAVPGAVNALPVGDSNGAVKIQTGTGTGQLDFTSGVVKSNIVQLLATAFTESGAGRIVAGIKKFFDLASPTSTMNQITLVDTTTTLTNAPSDSSGVTTLVSRLTSARAGYLDNLSGGAVALHSDIDALNQSASRRIVLTTVGQYERPESGTSTYTIEGRTYDGDGAAVNADSTPTLTATGIVSGSLAANLSASSNPATGVYRWTYTVNSTDTLEQVRFDISATLSSSTFTLSAYTQVADFVSATFTTTDRSAITAIKTKTDNLAFTSGKVDSQTRGMDTDVMTAAALAASAVTEIQSGLATAASITALNNLSLAQIQAMVVEGTLTFQQAMRICLAVLAGKADGAATATMHFRDQADSKNRITATVDADGNRTAVTVDGS